MSDTITEESQLGGFSAPGTVNDDVADNPRHAHRRVNSLPEPEPEPVLPPSGYALSVANSRRADLLRRLRVDLESLQLHGPKQVGTYLNAGMHDLGARQAEQNRQAELDKAAEIAGVEALDAWPLVVELAPAIAAELGYRG
jgi:hypothetical protein